MIEFHKSGVCSNPLWWTFNVDLKFSTCKVCMDLTLSTCKYTSKTHGHIGFPLFDPCDLPAPLITPLFTTAFLLQRELVGDWELGEVLEVRAVLRLVI